VSALTSTDRTDLNRAARLIALITVAGPAIGELLRPWEIRFPAIGAVVAAAEVLWTAYTKQAAEQPPAATIPAPKPPTDTYLS